MSTAKTGSLSIPSWAVGRNTNTTVPGYELSRVQVRGNIVVNTLQKNCTVAGVYALGHMAGKALLTAGRILTHKILAGSPSCVWSQVQRLFSELAYSVATYFDRFKIQMRLWNLKLHKLASICY